VTEKAVSGKTGLSHQCCRKMDEENEKDSSSVEIARKEFLF
jgi:hypothetical protein